MIGFRLPKDDQKYQWTNHVKDKMVYYGISESRIKRIIRFPKRKEEGIAPKTIAVMQPVGNKNKPQEIWVMYQDIISKKAEVNPFCECSPAKSGSRSLVIQLASSSKSKKRIISAWRYPGISPVGQRIPIPDEILQELDSLVE